MNSEKRELIHDLLATDIRREATLLAAGQVLRRRRFVRTFGRQSLAVALVLVIAFVLLPRPKPVQPSMTASSPAPRASIPAQTEVRAITDEELLALFPETPVALAKLADGHKRLLFPRPGDEDRFISKL